MAKGQESFTISPYPLFVVRRLVGTYGRGKSSVIDFIVKDWIRGNPEVVRDAKATIEDFRRTSAASEEVE